MKTYPISSSSLDKFEKCPRWWWLYKIKNIPFESDFTYADGGSVVHHTLEKYYLNEITEIDKLKEYFEKEWKEYKLDKTFLNPKYDIYWLMVLNSINKEISATDVEIKIFFEDAISYIDFMNKDLKIVRDHKSSTRSSENETSYRRQMLYYAWMIDRKYGWIPKKCVVDYLKYNGSKGELSFEFTREDVNKFNDYFNSVKDKMIDIENNNKEPETKTSVNDCAHFCPYKQFCFEQKEKHIYTLTEKNGYVETDINDPFLEEHIIKKFSYVDKNLVFLSKRLNKKFKTKISLYNRLNKSLPFGLLKELKKTLTDYAEHKGKELVIINKSEKDDEVKLGIKMPDKLSKDLRDYQKEAVDKYINSKYSRNTLVLPTGAGKTLIAMEIIRQLNLKTLFIVNRRELMTQTIEQFKKEFGEENVGQIGSGKFEPNFITVATIQTLINKKENNYLKEVDFVIYDEAHNAPADSYYTINKFLPNVKNVLGLTATPYREDGKEIMIFGIAGYVVYTVNINNLIGNKHLVKPNIIFINYDIDSKHREREILKDFVELCNNDKEIIEKKKKLLYDNFYNEFIVFNSIRNDLIKEIVDMTNKKSLILVKSVKHGILLSELLNVKYISGTTPKKERTKIFNDFKENKTKTLIGTFSIFSEGIDIPNIDIVINAGANSGKVKTIQMLGRCLRNFSDKQNGYYIDFKDKYRMISLATYKRMKSLKDEGHIVNNYDIYSLKRKGL